MPGMLIIVALARRAAAALAPAREVRVSKLPEMTVTLSWACSDALSVAMTNARERHGIFAFTGNTRHHVVVHCLKDFADGRFVAPVHPANRAALLAEPELPSLLLPVEPRAFFEPLPGWAAARALARLEASDLTRLTSIEAPFR